MTTFRIAACLMLCATPALGQAVPAAAPQPLVQSKDWTALATTTTPKGCHALTQPKKSEPANLKHDPVFFFITTKPAEKIRNEPSLQVGYKFKEGSSVTVDIDGRKFTMFTKGDSAWVQGTDEEAKLVDAMKKGRDMKVAATSGRGNATSYQFSLAGISGALDAVAKECK